MAEREGFEPPIPVKVWLISSQLHSTGLCHLSARLLVLVYRKVQSHQHRSGREAARSPLGSGRLAGGRSLVIVRLLVMGQLKRLL